MAGKLVETLGIEVSGVPIDTNGAAHTGDRYNLKHYGKIGFLIVQGAWAGGTPAVTLQQHDAATAGNSKALSFRKRWTKVALTGANWTEQAVASDTFNLAATPASMTFVEVDAEELDTDNNYGYVSVNVASPGANADLLCVVALLDGARYMGAANTLPDPKV